MGEHCCQKKSEDLKALAKKQSQVLWAVLGINLTMFFVEFASGIYAKSISLTGDSLDMLGDAMAYGSSLYVVNKSSRAKAQSAQFKASLMALLGLVVFIKAIYRIYNQDVPTYEVMGAVALLALAANALCLMLLTRHKNDDINFTSVWTCSRNDIIANISVMAAAGLVSLTGSIWPDVIVGLGITFLFLRSSLGIFTDSRKVLAGQDL